MECPPLTGGGTSWVGDLTFTGTYANSTYYTASGCSLAVDKEQGMAFLTIQGGTTSSYENIYFNASNMTLPTGVSFLPTQNWGGPTGGATQRYYTAVFTGITGIVDVNVNLGTINGIADCVTPTITLTVATGGNESSGVNLITFTIGGTTYQAEEGMTWEEWCPSSYNTDDFYVTPGGYVDCEAGYVNYNNEDVLSEKEIIANGKYTFG